MNPHHITIDEYWLNFALGTLLPILVALAKRRYSSGAVGAVLLVAFAAVTEALRVGIGNGGQFELRQTIVGLVIAVVTGAATHFGVLKPAGVTGTDGVVQRAVSGGLGSPRHAARD